MLREEQMLGAIKVAASEVAKMHSLSRACSAGRVEAAKFLVEGSGAPLEAKDRLGATPLFVAAATAEKDIALYLISRGADVEVGYLFCASYVEYLASRLYFQLGKIVRLCANPVRLLRDQLLER